LPISIGLAVVAAVVYAFMPQPVRVDLAQVTRGPLQVSVDERGKTRIKDRYVVSSPLAGRLSRIELLPGDNVEAGKTIVALIEPGDPALLDPRAVAEAEARVKAAEARLRQAGTALEQSTASLQYAEHDLNRVHGLRARGSSTTAAEEEASMRYRMHSEEARGARFAEEIARFELEQARAALMRTTPHPDAPNGLKNASIGSRNPPPADPDKPPDNKLHNGDWFFQIHSPINGRVLWKYQESSTIVTPGTQLLQLGDPENLEVVVDVLSADGVRISPGDKVLLEQWGGEKPLAGRVRLVEPSAFTKISSLGVEEQRVNVIIDFDDQPQKRRTLGDAFRVEAKIITWESPDVLRVPIGALFRHDDDWAVFVIRDGRARLQILKIGHRNSLNAEVLDGLKERDEIVMHPSDQVVDGVRIVRR
jgi:HlyD family secretion protein